MSDRVGAEVPRTVRYLEAESECLERNPHFHKRSMERDGRCELCGVSDR